MASSAQTPPPTYAEITVCGLNEHAAYGANGANGANGPNGPPTSFDVSSAETELRGLTDPSAPGGAALLDAVRAALTTRLLVGPDIVSAVSALSAATGGRDAGVLAAALAAALAAQGLDGDIGVAVAGDVKALAAGAMRSIGRVNWLVHGPTYESVGAELLAEDDEL